MMTLEHKIRRLAMLIRAASDEPLLFWVPLPRLAQTQPLPGPW